MRNILIAGFGAATIACSFAGPASATAEAESSPLLAIAAGPVRLAVNVCGNHGCAPVQVSRPHKRQSRPPTTVTPPHSL